MWTWLGRYNFKVDPLWEIILTELRTSLLLLAPNLGNKNFRNSAQAVALRYLEYEYLLSQLEDALTLSKLRKLDGNLKSINLDQLVRDLAEANNRRFPNKIDSPISFLVEQGLPTIQSYPELLMRILDCLYRKVHRLGLPLNSEIVIQRADSMSRARQSLIQISCAAIPCSVEKNRIVEIMTQFRERNYAKIVRDLGLEKCTALYIANQLNAQIKLDINNASLQLDLIFGFDRAQEQNQEETNSSPLPNKFYFSVSSSSLRNAIERIAYFHGLRAIELRPNQEISNKAMLVLDSESLQSSVVAKDFSNERIILLTYSNDYEDNKALVERGYNNILPMPIASTQLIQSLCGVHTVKKMPERITKKMSKLRILIVDDAQTARILLKDHFEAQGHVVVEASDGLEFVNYIKFGEKFDIVFTDMNMCHVDGASAVSELRKIEQMNGTAYTPVVLMTSYAFSNKDAYLTMGFDDYISKPVEARKLDEMMSKLLNSHSPAHETCSPTIMIDLDDLRTRCAGRNKTMIRVLDSFMESSRKHVPDLRSCCMRKNTEAIEKILHAIKGLLRDVGAKSGAALVQEMENKVKNELVLSEQDYEYVERVIKDACSSATRAKLELESQLGSIS